MSARSLGLLFAVGLLAAPASAAAIETADHYPTVGVETMIRFDSPAKSVTMTYSPGASVAKEVKVVLDAPASQLAWKPERAGVVKISTDTGESRNVSVKFDGVPPLGLAIMVLAGLVLFGGAAMSLRDLFAESREQ